jgi:hypothetical protein
LVSTAADLEDSFLFYKMAYELHPATGSRSSSRNWELSANFFT